MEMGDRETGGGWAFVLARCLRDNACKSCFGRPEAGSDAPAEPDVRIDVSAPPVDALPDLAPVPDVRPEAEASAPPIEASIDADAAPSDDANVVGSTSDDAVSGGAIGDDASASDADSDI